MMTIKPSLTMSQYIKQLQELMEKEGDLEIVSRRSHIPIDAYFTGFHLPQVRYKRAKAKREQHDKVWCEYDDKKYGGLKKGDKVYYF